MKNRAFSYLELIIAMTLVVIVVILTAPLMTSMGKKSTPRYGEYKCYARLVNGTWKLYQNERVNSDEYPKVGKNGYEDEEVEKCEFSKPVGNISSYTVTIYGGGGSGSMPEMKSIGEDSITFIEGGDGNKGEEKSIVDTLEKAFDSDGSMKIYFCDDNKHLDAKNCVGKGGMVNPTGASVEYKERIEEIVNSKNMNASNLSFLLQRCTKGSFKCTKDNLLYNIECMMYNSAGSEDTYIANCTKSCSQEKSIEQDKEIPEECLEKLETCKNKEARQKRGTPTKNDVTTWIKKCKTTDNEYKNCLKKNTKTVEVWKEVCPDKNECAKKYSNLKKNCSSSSNYYLTEIKECANSSTCDTTDETKLTGYSGKSTKIILSSGISFSAAGGLYGISDRYSPNTVEPEKTTNIYYSPEKEPPNIKNGKCLNCNGEDANNPIDSDSYENYGLGGKRGIFACPLKKNATGIAKTCYSGLGGAGAGGAIIIQWN